MCFFLISCLVIQVRMTRKTDEGPIIRDYLKSTNSLPYKKGYTINIPRRSVQKLIIKPLYHQYTALLAQNLIRNRLYPT